MKKSYSNLAKTPTTAELEPTWTTEMERQAELTLLSNPSPFRWPTRNLPQ